MTSLRLLFLIFAASVIAGCSVAAQSRSTIKADPKFRAAADYSEDKRGLSMMVIKGDDVVFEEYHNGHSAEASQMLASGTKSFAGVLLAAAIEDKIVTGFDEKVADTITEWKTDPLAAKMTVRQLLHLTGGISSGPIGRPPSYADAIKYNGKFEPGSTFEYGPVAFQAFGEILRRKLLRRNETVDAYLNRRILSPLDIKVARWNGSPGQSNLPSGAYLTTREWAKFGRFLLQDGKWSGKQIIKSSLLDELYEGSKANPNYGLTFWLNRSNSGTASVSENQGRMMGRLRRITGRNESNTTTISKNGIGPEIPKDLFMAAGAGNQRLYVIPSMDMVIVRQARQGDFDDRTFLQLVLGIERQDGNRR